MPRHLRLPAAAVAVTLLLGAVPFFGAAPAARPAARLSRYVEYARAAADRTWERRDEIVAAWRKGFDPEYVFGYNAPGSLLEMAAIYAELYARDRRPLYADRAKDVLLTYGDYRSQYPAEAARKRFDYSEGVPALPNFFTAMRYIRAFETLDRLGRISAPERDRIADVIAGSMTFLLQTQEWGPMNRSALRAETLAWAVRALPRHPDAAAWEMQREALGGDNWDHWEIEDAQLYNGVWLYSLLGYADARGRVADLLRTPTHYYYARYFLELLAPMGMVPDFGDSRWLSNWQHFLVYFEAAAKACRDPELKWAAAEIAARFVDLSKPPDPGLAYMLLDAARWGTDDVAPVRPSGRSREVLDDIVGKKVVFRSGWEPGSTYLLLNYRDEGDGGLAARDFLRDTIPVEEEKMTHGHADENSVAMLMSGGATLLRDGGYRDYMPSGPYGAYRQDYLHNRLCVRPEKIFWGQAAGQSRYEKRDAVPGQGVLEFMRNAGSYRRVRTQKVDFLSFPDFDYARTRLLDDDGGYESDRVVVYVKDPEAFVVFDVFKARREGFFTLANLWHTRVVAGQGEHWYDAGYDRLGAVELPRTRDVLIAMPPLGPREERVEPEKRNWQDETALIQAAAQHFELGGTMGFVTVLVPHAAGDGAAAAIAAKIALVPCAPDGKAFGVRLEGENGRSVMVGIKADLRMDISRDWRRPRYTYEAGRIAVGGFQTDGDFVFGALGGGRLAYTIVNLTKASYGETALVETRDNYFGLAFDGSPDHGGKGKLRYWRGTIDIK